MKTLFILVSFLSFNLMASEFQNITGEEAYRLFLKLPGVKCTEWNSKDFVVYTKYGTKSCDEVPPSTNWTCTIQISKLNSSEKFMSADCTREIP